MHDMKVIILGRDIGTASGWDEISLNEIVFYDFKSSDLEKLDSAYSLFVNFEDGFYQLFYENDNESELFDLPTLVMKYPRTTKLDKMKPTKLVFVNLD